MIIIGELINATRKKVGEALKARDAGFFTSLACAQDEAGADVIDVNAGADPSTELEDMRWAIGVVQEATAKPLAIDSPSPTVLRAGLESHQGKARPMLNSVTLEADRLESVAALAVEFQTQVVALAMGEAGMPCGQADRVHNAKRLIDELTARGVAPEDIFVDPVITPVSTDPTNGGAILGAIRQIRDYSPQGHVTCGLSNISFGLPERKLVNRTFLALALGAGLDSAIMDPLDREIMAVVYAAEALLGRDDFCMNYVMASREGKL